MKKGMQIFLRIISKTLFLALSLWLIYFVGTKSFEFVYQFMSDTPSENKVVRDVEIEIPQGANTSEIAEILEEAELIENATVFNLKVKFLSEYDGRFRYGTYMLNTGMTEDEIMEVLATQGEQRATITFTIPEGYSVQQIAKKLESEGIISQSDFIDAINNVTYDYPFFDEIPDRNLRLQGYLFPDTYEIYEDSSAKDIVSRMLSRFDQIFIEEYYARAETLGYTVDEIITLASLIEKEAKMEEERATIAGVMYNRLNMEPPMKLQIDATIQYIKSDGDYQPTRVLYADLEIDSLYNTYKYEGIPVGPISNPGQAAIQAALYPESHEYLYYLLIDEETGEHVFNTTLEDHNRDKNKYIN